MMVTKPWDGKERRVVDARFEAAMDDVKMLDQNVGSLRRDMKLFNKLVGLVTVIVILLIATTIAQLNDLHNRSIVNRTANRAAQVITINAVNCILHSLHQHREANEYAHQLIAQQGVAHPIPYTEPPELVPPPESDAVKASCTELDKLLKDGLPGQVVK